MLLWSSFCLVELYVGSVTGILKTSSSGREHNTKNRGVLMGNVKEIKDESQKMGNSP